MKLPIRYSFVFILVTALNFHVMAQPVPPLADLKPRPTGVLGLDGIELGLLRFSPDWAATSQSHAQVSSGFPQMEAGAWVVQGTMRSKADATRITFIERLTPSDENSFNVEYSVTQDEEGWHRTQELCLAITLPGKGAIDRSYVIDGKKRIFPKNLGASTLANEMDANPRTILLPTDNGTLKIEGAFGVLVQDERRWNKSSFTVRLRFSPPESGKIETVLKLRVRHIPWKSVPVSLREVSNRGFRDDTAGDGIGGWTDQGPSNDLGAIPVGKLKTLGLTFDVIDPNTNGGKAAVVIGKRDSTTPQSVTILIPDKPRWRNLYLLHAAAWMTAHGKPAGTLHIHYIDGTETRKSVVAGLDVGNWWSPVKLSRAEVGWLGENQSSRVGLYVTRFAVEYKPVTSVSLEAADGVLWMVAAVTGSPDDIVSRQATLPQTITAGRDWSPYDHSLEIEPGSAFDFSFLADAPAGKHGRLLAKNGHFEFETKPGESVRFWGVNLCFTANYLEHDEADRLAKRLAASGYNAVRFHHYDRELVSREVVAGGDSSCNLSPERLDKLDYLFAAMKKHGLYVTTDLFTARSFTASEMAAMGMDPDGDTKAQFKALIPISDEAFRIWAEFSRRLMTHRNPYTGLTWAEDPALIGICPVNEENQAVWTERNPELRKRYKSAFLPWWAEAVNQKASGGDEKIGFNRFIYEQQIAADARMFSFLRDLGVKALLTGANFENDQPLAFVRQHYDYVDNHQYWDHPKFPEVNWRLPFAFDQRSAISSLLPTPRGMMPTRLWGKPFVVSEFNYVKPNQYRAEGGVIMPAYASLQDWDGLYNFEYASRQKSAISGDTEGTFALSDDPIGLLADRVSALLFRRRDIAPAHRAIGFAVRSPGAFTARETAFPTEFSQIGLISRIGSGTRLVEDEKSRNPLDAVISTDDGSTVRLKASGLSPGTLLDAGQQRFMSDTEQIALDGKAGTMRVSATRCELFVLPAGQSLEGHLVTVKNGATFGTVSVVSVDGSALSNSERVLITHLTDALASGMRFQDQERLVLMERGRLPYLVRAGSAEVHLKLNPDKSWRAWVLSATGRRLREVALHRDGDALVLQASTVTTEGTQLAYELTAESKERREKAASK